MHPYEHHTVVVFLRKEKRRQINRYKPANMPEITLNVCLKNQVLKKKEDLQI